MFKFYAVVFALPVLTYRDCGGCDGGSTPPPPVDACADYLGQATEAEIDGTPRARPDLEAFAIALDGTFVADPTRYARLGADLDAMWDLEPAIDGITYRAGHSTTRLLVGASGTTLAQMQSGTYAGWTCENAFYEATSVQVQTSYAIVTFPGTYDMTALAEEYAGLPGVEYAEPDMLFGGGSTVCAVPGSNGVISYLVDRAWGDCPAGCINHHYYYFTSTAAGTVTYEGDWDASDPDMAPLWPAVSSCF